MLQAAGSRPHLNVNGGREDVLDEAQQLVGLQQVSSGRVLQGEVPFHWVREEGVREQTASDSMEEGRDEEVKDERK